MLAMLSYIQKVWAVGLRSLVKWMSFYQSSMFVEMSSIMLPWHIHVTNSWKYPQIVCGVFCLNGNNSSLWVPLWLEYTKMIGQFKKLTYKHQHWDVFVQHCQILNPCSPNLLKGKTYSKSFVLFAYLPNI